MSVVASLCCKPLPIEKQNKNAFSKAILQRCFLPQFSAYASIPAINYWTKAHTLTACCLPTTIVHLIIVGVPAHARMAACTRARGVWQHLHALPYCETCSVQKGTIQA